MNSPLCLIKTFHFYVVNILSLLIIFLSIFFFLFNSKMHNPINPITPIIAIMLANLFNVVPV